jgi:hypothetical protein
MNFFFKISILYPHNELAKTIPKFQISQNVSYFSNKNPINDKIPIFQLGFYRFYSPTKLLNKHINTRLLNIYIFKNNESY